jgi:D-alanyl-lipoteichoic acid acyltransferase DltB (MBOAT superfamily)
MTICMKNNGHFKPLCMYTHKHIQIYEYIYPYVPVYLHIFTYIGINAPENMTRCMTNNYNLEQFWKGWHSSFNKWIVRYLYIPLGGAQNRMVGLF